MAANAVAVERQLAAAAASPEQALMDTLATTRSGEQHLCNSSCVVILFCAPDMGIGRVARAGVPYTLPSCRLAHFWDRVLCVILPDQQG